VKSSTLLAFVGVSLSAFSGVGHASIIFSDNFDTVRTGTNKTGAVGDFTVTGGNVDVVGTFPTSLASNLCVSPESGNCIDLNGNTAGTLTSSAISLAVGTYTLQFDLNGTLRGNSSSTTVTFGGFTQTYLLTTSSKNTFSIPIIVGTAGSSQIVFKSNLRGASGALLDNVEVTGPPAGGGGGGGTVPEPATALLMLGGSALTVAMRRRFSAN
jgi:hypothetical protein